MKAIKQKDKQTYVLICRSDLHPNVHGQSRTMGWSLSSHLNTKYIEAALPFDIWKQTISKKRRSRIAPYLCSIRKFYSRSTVLTGPRLELCNFCHRHAKQVMINQTDFTCNSIPLKSKKLWIWSHISQPLHTKRKRHTEK